MTHFHHYYTQDEFLSAVRLDDTERLERLLSQHTDVVVCRRAAEQAAGFGHAACLQLLLPHCGHYNFDVAITTAATKFQPLVVEELVKRYPPDMVDTIRLENAYQKRLCEESVWVLLPYFSLAQKFSFMINVAAPMSTSFVSDFIAGMDPLFGDSVMLSWGAIYNDARFDVLYPISDPEKAIGKLNKIASHNHTGAINVFKLKNAIERLEARMQREVLTACVPPSTAVSKSKM